MCGYVPGWLEKQFQPWLSYLIAFSSVNSNDLNEYHMHAHAVRDVCFTTVLHEGNGFHEE